MTESRKVQLEITADGTGARAGFDQVKQGARDMAQAVTQAGEQASKGINGIGNGGDQAAAKVDKATSSIVGSVQRATAALQAGEKGSAKYFEALANQRGISSDVLKPYLEQLRKAEEAQRVASGGLQNMGISAAQTAAAMRNVPAQITDIVVGLQAGQAPMTVLLQQGGQLKDMFGGVAPAARALGSALLSLVNPATIAAAAVGAVAIAYFKGASETSEFNKQIALTGNITGTTSGQLGAMAANVSKVVGTQAQAAEVLALLVGTGRVAVGSMQGATEAIIAMSKASGIAVDQLVKDFAELGKAPTESIYTLNEQYHFLTQSTYAQIKALEDQGRKEEAAALAQKTYESALKERATGVVNSAGFIERAWKSAGEAASYAWDQMLAVGRPKLQDEILANAKTQLESMRKLREFNQSIFGAQQKSQPEQNLELAIVRMQEKSVREQGAAATQSARQRAQDAATDATKAIEEQRKALMTGAAKVEKELTTYRDRIAKIRLVDPNSPLLDPKLIASDEAAIKDKGVDKGALAASRREANAAQTQIQKALALVDELAAKTDGMGLSPKYTEQVALLANAYHSGAISLETYNQAQEQLLQRQPFAIARAKEQAEAERQWQTDRKKRFDEIENQYDQEVKAAENSAKSVQDRVQQLADEDQALSRSKMMHISLAEAIEDVRIARLTEARAAAASAGNQKVVDALNAEIEARRQLKVLTVGKEAKAVAADAAKQAEQDWKRSAQIIEQSLTDALMRGFESGKGFMRSLRDSAVNMFKTMVLRPVVSAIVNPVAGALSGALGFGSGAANAAGAVSGAGGAMSTLSTLSSLGSAYTMMTGGITSSIAGAIGGAGSLFGSSALTSFAAGMQGTTAATGLLAEGSAGAIGAGSSFAAAIPYLAPLAIIGMIAASMGAFDGASYHSGSAIGVNADGSTTGRLENQATFGDQRVWGGFTEVDKRGGAAFADPLTTIGTTIVNGLNTTFKTFGLDRRVSAYTAFGADGKDASEGVLRILGNDGFALGDRKKYSTDASKGLQEYLADAGRVARDALVSADIPGWAKSILTELGAAPELQAVAQSVQKINEAQAALVSLGESMAQISGLSGSTVSALVQAFGSVDGLISSTKSYFDLYYTDAEKVADSTRRMSKALAEVNLTLPKSKEELRSLVEGVDLTTDSGRKAYAVLLQVAPQFSSTADAVRQMTTDVQSSFLAMTQGIVSEIDRIKGLAVEQSAGGVAELQARFAVATAQARSGDTTAIDQLPKLSQALLKAAEATAASSLDLRSIQAQTLASLQATLNYLGEEATKKAAIPGFAAGGDFGGGWRVVGERGRELEATGAARIFNSDQTARILSGGPSDGGATSAALVAMQQTLAGLRDDQRIQAAQIAHNTAKVARLLEGVTPNGNSLSVTTS
jgi:phage-related minor tail protein